MGAKRTVALGVAGIGGVAVGLMGVLAARYLGGRQRVEAEWAASRYPKLKDVDSVQRLSILPLIDWYTAGPELESEPGVSYLVRADDTTILFDVGYNRQSEHPSPLLRNMDALGIDVSDLDAIVISHAHEDHQGGIDQMRQGSFCLSAQPQDLNGIPAYVPVPLRNESAKPTLVNDPQKIGPGVFTMGAIPREMFLLGRTLEQSLAVNVAGKGLVVIVGCGHPTLQRIVDRAEVLFDEPVYGLVGGLHYPVTESREKLGPIQLQKVLGTGKWPWDPVNETDVETAISYLKDRNPQLVGLSPHDSCDWSLGAFKKAFGSAYRDVVVGQEIVI